MMDIDRNDCVHAARCLLRMASMQDHKFSQYGSQCGYVLVDEEPEDVFDDIPVFGVDEENVDAPDTPDACCAQNAPAPPRMPSVRAPPRTTPRTPRRRAPHVRLHVRLQPYRSSRTRRASRVLLPPRRPSRRGQPRVSIDTIQHFLDIMRHEVNPRGVEMLDFVAALSDDAAPRTRIGAQVRALVKDMPRDLAKVSRKLVLRKLAAALMPFRGKAKGEFMCSALLLPDMGTREQDWSLRDCVAIIRGLVALCPGYACIPANLRRRGALVVATADTVCHAL